MVRNFTILMELMVNAAPSTIVTDRTHLIAAEFHFGNVLSGITHPEKVTSIGNSKQFFGIWMVLCPKLVIQTLRLFQNHLFTLLTVSIMPILDGILDSKHSSAMLMLIIIVFLLKILILVLSTASTLLSTMVVTMQEYHGEKREVTLVGPGCT